MPGGAEVTESGASILQWLLDATLGVVMLLGGFVLKSFRADHQALVKRHNDLEHSIPETYARRDDVKDGFAEMRAQHAEIARKLDRLIERS